MKIFLLIAALVVSAHAVQIKYMRVKINKYFMKRDSYEAWLSNDKGVTFHREPDFRLRHVTRRKLVIDPLHVSQKFQSSVEEIRDRQFMMSYEGGYGLLKGEKQPFVLRRSHVWFTNDLELNCTAVTLYPLSCADDDLEYFKVDYLKCFPENAKRDDPYARWNQNELPPCQNAWFRMGVPIESNTVLVTFIDQMSADQALLMFYAGYVKGYH